MIIGIDIDNVITDFDNNVINEFIKQSKDITAAKKRIADLIEKRLFDWSSEEFSKFLNDNLEEIAKRLKPRRNCKKYMDKLLSDGHKLILISHRAYSQYKNPLQTTVDWLKNKNINYTKLIISNSPDKTDECKRLKADIMFDDRVDKCKIMRENGINCYLMFTKYNCKEKGNLPFVSSWESLYKLISSQ